MHKKHLFFLPSLIVALLSTFTANAQKHLTKEEAREILQKIEESTGSIKTMVYKIDYDMKSLTVNDTLHTIAVCSLYIAPKDRMKAYHIVDEEYAYINSHRFAHKKYDGKRMFNINYPFDSLSVYKEPFIVKGRKEVRNWVQSYSYLLLGDYFVPKKSSGKSDLLPENILFTEEVHKGTPVYIITVNYDDDEYARDRVEKLYISKSDYLPVAFYSFWRWENMEKYDYYEVKYLAINPDIPIEEFKIGEDETIDAAERYRMFKEKAKI